MITKNVTIKITDDRATLSEKIILYKDDKGIDIYFTLSGFSYKFNKDNLSLLVKHSLLPEISFKKVIG